MRNSSRQLLQFAGETVIGLDFSLNVCWIVGLRLY